MKNYSILRRCTLRVFPKRWQISTKLRITAFQKAVMLYLALWEFRYLKESEVLTLSLKKRKLNKTHL
jgi:hypothetical protein